MVARTTSSAALSAFTNKPSYFRLGDDGDNLRIAKLKIIVLSNTRMFSLLLKGPFVSAQRGEELLQRLIN